ncbi:MAG: PfkB family carbohydrate kinase [Chloroflexota bacterium]|nr:PfkB family carbohydrate kinase [Chloroflexota bacterium]
MARIAAIGLIEHDAILLLDSFPNSGEAARISAISQSPGGTTANTAVALVRLGESVTLRAVIGNDDRGDELLKHFDAGGIDCGMITRTEAPTSTSTILLETQTGERTILWHEGATIRKGDQLDVADLFSHDVVILDVLDEPLRRFLTDLPAHTRPDVRLLGPITHLVDNAEPDAVEIAFRFDTIVGNERQYLQLLGLERVEEIDIDVQRRMPGANLRAAIVTSGAQGCRWVTRDERGTTSAFVVDTVDTTGAGDAFVAGIAWSMARRLPWPDATRFASAVAALSTRSVGAQTALPTLSDVELLLNE